MAPTLTNSWDGNAERRVPAHGVVNKGPWASPERTETGPEAYGPHPGHDVPSSLIGGISEVGILDADPDFSVVLSEIKATSC